MREILVVANQTLGGDPLLSTLRERMRAQPTQFWIVVPVKKEPDRLMLGPGCMTVVLLPAGRPAGNGYEVADRRLKNAIVQLRRLGGVVAGGEVGDTDPLRAVAEVLERRHVDEVIVSTLPVGLSHWLRADLPSRVHRKFHVPVTTVTARGGRVRGGRRARAM